jgi:hypothetical protein
MQNIRGYTRQVFAEFWEDRDRSRARFPIIKARVMKTPAPPVPEPEDEADDRPGIIAAMATMALPSFTKARQTDRWSAFKRTPTKALPRLVPGQSLPKLGEGLRKLSHFPKTLRGTWITQPWTDDRLDLLRQVAKDLERATSGLRTPPPPDPEALTRARARWVATGYRLDLLDRSAIRLLCQDSATGLQPRWVEALLQGKIHRVRRSWVEGLLALYLAHWRAMNHADELEEALRRLLASLPPSEAWVIEANELGESVLGPEAPTKLLDLYPDPAEGCRKIIDQVELTRSAGLGLAVLVTATERWQALWNGTLKARDEATTLHLLENGLKDLLQHPELPEETFLKTIATVILSERSSRFQSARDAVLEFCLRHPRLGDPRRHKHAWVTIQTAKGRLISWMAKKDLRLFYDSVVADHADDQGRKAFWLQYINRVVDFRLVLSQDDEARLESLLGTGLVHHAQMEGTNKPSAFLLRFHEPATDEDIICVEFSRTGNSLYIFDTTSFEAGVGRLEAMSFRIGAEPRNLKNREYVRCEPIRHQGDWQSRVTQYLLELGIKPA